MSLSKRTLLGLSLAVALAGINILLPRRGTEEQSNINDISPRSLNSSNAIETPSFLIDVPETKTSLRVGTENKPSAESVAEDDKESWLFSEPTYNEILDELDVLSGGDKAKDLECPHPLVPFRNILFKQNTTNANKADEDHILIPKILHVSMKSRCLPQDLAVHLDRWREVLPTYSIFFHDDEAVSRMIEQDWSEFPDLHKAMKCVIFKGAMKIDVWRVLLLYKYGGVYSDIDNWPMDGFNESTIRSDLSAFFLTDAFNRPSQWFMAAEPKHKIMYLAMKQIISNILNIPRMDQIRTVWTTGPAAVRDGYRGFLENAANWQQKNTILTGMLGKKVMKRATDGLIVGKHGWDKIVPYNSTAKTTVGERIRLESGVAHWKKTQYWAQKNRTLALQMSCQKYIESLDNGTAAALNL